MLNQKQLDCLKFLSVKHNWKFKKKKLYLFAKENFPPDKRHPGHRSRYGKYGPRSGYGFLRAACQPIRIENFEKPYKKLELHPIPPSPLINWLEKLRYACSRMFRIYCDNI